MTDTSTTVQDKQNDDVVPGSTDGKDILSGMETPANLRADMLKLIADYQRLAWG